MQKVWLGNRIFYRIRQWGMSIVIKMNQKKEPDLIVLCGAVLKLPELLHEEDIRNVLVVTTNGMIKRGTLEELFTKMKKDGIKVNIYSDVVNDPTVECVEHGVKKYVEEKCEAIIAIGGGSTIDCAKIIGARVVRPDKSISKMRGTLKINKKLPTFFAVPTTAGTGSEATAAAVITDTIAGVHYKYPIDDLCLIPRYAILDPNLTVGLPAHISAITGMDALTHSIEAYCNHFASKKARESARKSMVYLWDNIVEVVEHGENVKAREHMLLGAYYGGVAITNNFVGYIHAIAHAVGALYGISHGEANAIIMPVVLEAYGKNVEKKLAELAWFVGIREETNEESAQKLIASIRQMNIRFSIPDKIEGLREEDFEIIMERAMKEANRDYPVPEFWNKEKLLEVLRKLC